MRSLVIDHRRRNEIVALEPPRHLLLVLGRAHHVALRLHQLGHRHRALGAHQPVERHRAEELAGRIDHIDFEEALGQILGLAHVVDGLSDGPGRRHRDELGLHPPPGGLFRIVEALRDRDALGRRQLLEDLRLLFLGQVLQDVDGVVGIELAHALGDGLGAEFLEDLLAHRVVDFGQRREVEVLAQQLDELRAEVVIERLDQVAGIGFVQLADQRAQQAGIAAGDRFRDGLDELGPDRAVLIAQTIGRSVGGCGDVLSVGHAGPRWTRDCAESPACTPGK